MGGLLRKKTRRFGCSPDSKWGKTLEELRRLEESRKDSNDEVERFEGTGTPGDRGQNGSNAASVKLGSTLLRIVQPTLQGFPRKRPRGLGGLSIDRGSN